jgi:hypothetical protein
MTLPEHLVGIGEHWAMWRWVALRGAGLPIDHLAGLSAADLAGPGEGTEQSFLAAVKRTGRQLRTLASDPTFREALTWQNRHALRTGVDVLLAAPAEAQRRSSKHRQKEALIANYLQRYCAKNDTIGFFGPVGWATLVDTGPAIMVEPGAELVADRTTHLEGWCVQKVAEGLASDETLLQWMAPRLPPYLRLDNATLKAPLAAPVQLNPAEAAMLELVDGRRSARDIAAELVGDRRIGLADCADHDAVYALLRKLRSAGRIVWTLEFSAEHPHPEQALRDRLSRVPSIGQAQSTVETLAAHRRAVADASGDPERLGVAMAALADWFSTQTGSASDRRQGESYAGRTLIYQDCRRDLTVQLGPDLVTALAPPLELLLTAARWFTTRAAGLYRTALIALYERLAARHGEPVPLPDLWLYAQDLIFGEERELDGTLAGEVRQRWAAVLGALPEGRRVDFRAVDLRDAVRSTFAAGPVTPGATRYCCPDVMIAAPSVAAIRHGDYQFVLGELHAGMNTLSTAFWAGQHPVPEELLRAVAADLPEPQVVAVYSRERVTPRMMRGLVRPRDLRLVFAQDTCGVATGQPVPIGSLLAERSEAGLDIYSRDGRVRFEAMELFAELVMLRAHQAFGVLSPAEHTPRISIDRLVVERERWRTEASELSFAWETDEWRRYRLVGQWRERHGMPQHVFLQTSRSTKPTYVDLAAPVLVDVLARTIRRAADRGEPVVVSEMLPGPEQVWLPDGSGRRYTCELRLVAINRP